MGNIPLGYALHKVGEMFIISGRGIYDAMWSSSFWVKPVQFAFWKLKRRWKGTIDSAMAAVMQMLIGRCGVLGIALRSPFLHTPAIFGLKRQYLGYIQISISHY